MYKRQTGGRTAVLGPTGKNFAAGMSGGIAYVLDEGNCLYKNLNKEMVLMEKVETKYDQEELRAMIEAHVAHTNSRKGKEILAHFAQYLPAFKKIIPADYKHLIQLSSQFEEQGKMCIRDSPSGNLIPGAAHFQRCLPR